MINIEDFDLYLLKIYKNIDIQYIGYITIKSISDYNSINSVNPFYFIIGEVDGNGNKYLIFAFTNKKQSVQNFGTKLNI